MLWKGDQSPRVKKEGKLALRGKCECFQWKAHGQCSKGDSCSFSHDIQDSGNCEQYTTNTARTELHCMITFHHANTRGSRLHIFVSLKLLSSTCHVSFLAAPDTDHKRKFSLTHFIHFFMSFRLCHLHKQAL